MLLNCVIIHKKAVIVSGFLSDDSGSELYPLFLRFTGIYPYRYMYCVFCVLELNDSVPDHGKFRNVAGIAYIAVPGIHRHLEAALQPAPG